MSTKICSVCKRSDVLLLDDGTVGEHPSMEGPVSCSGSGQQAERRQGNQQTPYLKKLEEETGKSYGYLGRGGIDR